MKYEVILKVKDCSHSSFEQIGRIVVPEEFKDFQIKSYEGFVKRRLHVFDHIILVNKLSDDGEFLEVVQ